MNTPAGWKGNQICSRLTKPKTTTGVESGLEQLPRVVRRGFTLSRNLEDLRLSSPYELRRSSPWFCSAARYEAEKAFRCRPGKASPYEVADESGEGRFYPDFHSRLSDPPVKVLALALRGMEWQPRQRDARQSPVAVTAFHHTKVP